MNRRMALMLTLLSGGLLPGRLMAQERGAASPGGRTTARPGRRPQDDLLDDLEPQVDDTPPANGNFRDERGHAWKTFDIARYFQTAYDPKNPKPQNSILEWIFRRTGTATWHGERLAALSASRSQIRAFHDPKTLDATWDVVRRFTKAMADVLSVRVRFVAAADPRWRYAVHTMLGHVGSGPQGQQIWLLERRDAEFVRAQLQISQKGRLLAEQAIKMVNGQVLTIETTDGLDFVAGPQREGAVGLGFQQGTQQLKEGVVLRFSPLLTYDGDALDADVELRANTIQRLIRTRILTRREVGPGEMTIDVPQVAETHLHQTVQNWPLSQSLLISGGITPGILQAKGGFMNLGVPGTVPKDTELLVFLDVETSGDAPRTARARDPIDRSDRDRARARDQDDRREPEDRPRRSDDR